MKHFMLAALLLAAAPAFATPDDDDLVAARTGYAYAAKLKTVAQADLARAQDLHDQQAASEAQDELDEAQAEHDRAYATASAIVTRNPLSGDGVSAASLIAANAF